MCFKGLLSDAAVEAMEQKRGISLSDDQWRVLRDINISSIGVQTIAAHAGTGKTLLSGFLLSSRPSCRASKEGTLPF